MSPEDNKDAVRRYCEGCFNWQQTGVLDELIDPSYVFHEPTEGDVYGLEGIKQLASAYKAAFPDLTLAVDDVIGEGDEVACRLTYRGTHTGDFEGLGPTGKQIEVGATTICRLAGEKIVEEWEVFPCRSIEEPPCGSSGSDRSGHRRRVKGRPRSRRHRKRRIEARVEEIRKGRRTEVIAAVARRADLRSNDQLVSRIAHGRSSAANRELWKLRATSLRPTRTACRGFADE